MKKMMLCFLTLCTAVLFHVSSAAYIDPSVVSGLVTAIAGVLVACSAAFFVIWRRLRAKVSKTLGIDENAGKEVEEELTINESVANELDTICPRCGAPIRPGAEKCEYCGVAQSRGKREGKQK